MKNTEYYMNLPYITEIAELSEEDGGGIVLCHPELGRLSANAWGETYEEARAMLTEIKRDIFERCLAEGLFIPEPKSEDLQKYSGKILLRMPRSLHKSVAEAADDEGQSINTYIIGALLKTTERGETVKEILDTVCCQVEKTLRHAACNLWSTGFYNPNRAQGKQAARRGGQQASRLKNQNPSPLS